MKKHYLTFEKSLKDFDHDIENLISIDSESEKLNQLKIERAEKANHTQLIFIPRLLSLLIVLNLIKIP